MVRKQRKHSHVIHFLGANCYTYTYIPHVPYLVYKVKCSSVKTYPGSLRVNIYDTSDKATCAIMVRKHKYIIHFVTCNNIIQSHKTYTFSTACLVMMSSALLVNISVAY